MNCRSGKQVYPSPQAAWHAICILDSSSHRGSKHNKQMKWAKGTLEGYKCQFCKQWHVGHSVFED